MLIYECGDQWTQRPEEKNKHKTNYYIATFYVKNTQRIFFQFNSEYSCRYSVQYQILGVARERSVGSRPCSCCLHCPADRILGSRNSISSTSSCSRTSCCRMVRSVSNRNPTSLPQTGRRKKQVLVKNMQTLKIKLLEQGKYPDTPHFTDSSLFLKITKIFQIYQQQTPHFF